MSYVILFPGVAGALLLAAWGLNAQGLATGALAAIVWAAALYGAAAFLTAAGLYALSTWTRLQTGPWLKKDDGRLKGGGLTVLLGPYLLANWAAMWISARASGRPVAHEVAPGLWVGRRPMPGDRKAYVAVRLGAVVDLCAELPEARWLRLQAGEHYLSLATMDLTAPGPAPLRRGVAWVLGQRQAGRPVLVHCAAGKGRSALLAVSVLLEEGRFSTVDEALDHVRRCRHGVVLNRVQRRAAEAFLKRTAEVVGTAAGRPASQA